MSIVEELRKAIANSGQTEYDIAQAAGVPQSVVNRFVRGERGIGLATASRICAHLGLHLARLRR